MKTIIIISTILIITSCAAPVKMTESDNLIKVYEDTKGTKGELYLRANDWMVNTFKDSKSVIQHSDKEEGVILGKYLLGKSYVSQYRTDEIFAVVDIRLKDNKSRIEIKPQGSWLNNGGTLKSYQYTRENAIRDMNKLADSFHKAMQKNAVDF